MQTQPTNPQTTAQPPASNNANRETVPELRQQDNNHPPTPPNNSLRPVPSQAPKGRSSKRRGRWLIALLLLPALGGTGFAGWYFYTSKVVLPSGLITHKIPKEKLQITITERGSLEPADNTFFSCKVKAKTPGGAATSIRWVIDNGSFVKEGDKILELDDSALKEEKTSQEILVFQALELLKKAELQKIIDLGTNQAAVVEQEVAVKSAEIILDEYVNGLYVQQRLDLQNKYDMARSDLFMWNERAVWSERMARPDRMYVTVSQAESDEARRKTAKLTVENFKKQLDVLDHKTKKRSEVEFQGNIDMAKAKLKTAKQTLEKMLESDNVAIKSAQSQYDKQMAKLDDILKDIDSCFIRAPRDGMVVYYVEERARWGQSGGVIAQGEQVKEGQKLIAVPDLSRMVVNARIHEAMVSSVRDDQVTYTGFSEAVNTALLFRPQALGAVSAYIAFDTDMQEAFARENEELEKKLDRHGMPATVRVNAFPNRLLKAHVKSVAPVASQTDFFSSDVKVYQTYIAIDDSRLDGIKPGMDAVVTIDVDSTPEPVLTIPVQALMGGVEMGDKRRCFVMVDGHPDMRVITLGKENGKVAEVKEGLQEGDDVVLNPGRLLSDKEKVEYGVSAPSGQGGDSAGPGDRGGRKGKGSKGGKGGKGSWKGKGGGAPNGSPGMKGGPGSQGGYGGGRRSQGGESSGGKSSAPANP